jgi:hypothetical protein
VMSKGDIVVEVECKMASADIGRKIHQRHMVELSSKLWPILKHASAHVMGGHVLTVVIQDRLTGQNDQHRMIADGVRSLLLGKVSACRVQGVEINVQRFELETSCFWGLSQKLITADVVQSFLSERLGLGPRHAFTYGEPYRCCFVVILESRKKDKVAEGIYR